MINSLNPGDVHIRCQNTDALDQATISTVGATLSEEERNRRDQLRFEHDKRDYTIAHSLLRQSLSKYEFVPPSEWVFEPDHFGKPQISAASWQSSGGRRRALSFSLSHTRGVVACAIAPGMPIGVDVERIDLNIDPTTLAKWCLSGSEILALRRHRGPSRIVRFFELWTLKEAFAKATGLGLSQPLCEISFDLDSTAAPTLLQSPAGIDLDSWRFALYAPFPHTRVAVAALRGEQRCVRFVPFP